MSKNPKEKLAFNFHNIVGLEVRSNDPAALRFYRSEYAFHKSDSELSAELPIVRFEFTRHHSADDSADMIKTSRKVLGRWAHSIVFRSGAIDIRVVGNHLSIPLTFHSLIHCALRYAAAERKVLLLHSGAVASPEGSLVFTGHGGAGKTTNTSLLLSSGKNWYPHADDYTFISHEGYSFAYITRAHLYRNILKWVPTVAQVLTPWERLSLEFLGHLRHFTRDWLAWPVRIPMNRLWPQKTPIPSSKIRKLLILKRCSTVPTLKPLNESERLEAMNDIIEMNFHEARHFLTYVRETMEPDQYEAWLTKWRKTETSLVENLFQVSAPCILEIPDIQPTDTAMRNHLVSLFNNLIAREGQYVTL